MVYVMCKVCRAGHQLENRVVIAREALRILALGVLSVMDDIEPKRRRRDLGWPRGERRLRRDGLDPRRGWLDGKFPDGPVLSRAVSGRAPR